MSGIPEFVFAWFIFVTFVLTLCSFSLILFYSFEGGKKK